MTQLELFHSAPPDSVKIQSAPFMAGHKVMLSYRPETSEQCSSFETITFSTRENALQFAERQKNLSQVMEAKYLGLIEA